MAEFLVMAQTRTHLDPTKDARGCWKRGDVVDVRPDGFVWGSEESLPRFVIVKIPGVTVAQAQKYMVPYLDLTDPLNPVAVARRLWRVRVDDVPAQIRNALRNTGVVTVTWTQIKGYVFNKLTGLNES